VGLIYLDTCLVIYLVEDNPIWSGRVRARMAAEGGPGFAISPLVAMECLVGPLRSGNKTIEQTIRAALGGFAMLPIEDVFEGAARIRAHFRLKTPDALHLACAQHHGCSAFWTNDRRFEAAGGPFVMTLGA